MKKEKLKNFKAKKLIMCSNINNNLKDKPTTRSI